MKISQLLLAFAIAFPMSLLADSPLAKNNNNPLYSLNKIFFDDDFGETLFIDFEVINDNLVELNIIREEVVLLSDNISDLPSDTIYEINLMVLRKGNYVVELVTADGIKIQKTVTIN